MESLCSEAFNGGLKLLAPRLAAAREANETVLRPLRYCHRTWRDGIVPFTPGLTQLREGWHDLVQEECPIPALSGEGQRLCQEHLDTYEKMLDVRREIISVLGAEQDRWEEARKSHSTLYETIMKT